MKPTFKSASLVTAAIAVVFSTVHLSAQDQPAGMSEASPRLQDDALHRPTHLGTLEKGDKITGMEIKDLGGNKLGKVKDLAMDLPNGRIVAVIVQTGRFTGMDAKTVVLPPQLFSCDATHKNLDANLDRDQIKTVEEFDESRWDENFTGPRVAGVYQQYEVRPYFNFEGAPAPTVSPRVAAASPALQPVELGRVERWSKLNGMEVKNLQGETIGKVDNALLDLPAGRVVELIISSGEFLGMRGELSAVPPAAFHFNSERNVLELDATRDSLQAAPHFTANEWPEQRSEYVSGVYRSYHVEPWFTAETDNTAMNARDRGDNKVTPMDQGNSRTDVEITRSIRREIMARKDLSVNAHNVKIITRDGQVTLRGPVDSEDEKRAVIQIARGVVVSPAGLDDQLDVGGRHASSDK